METDPGRLFRWAAGWVRRDLWLVDWSTNRALVFVRAQHRRLLWRVLGLGSLPMVVVVMATPWALATVAQDPWLVLGAGPWLFAVLVAAGIATVVTTTTAWVSTTVASLPREHLRMASITAAEVVQAVALPPLAMTPLVVGSLLVLHALVALASGWRLGIDLLPLAMFEGVVVTAAWLALRPLAEATAAFATRAHLFLSPSSTAATRTMLDLVDIAWPMLGIVARVALLGLATLWLLGACAAPDLEPGRVLTSVPIHAVLQVAVLAAGLAGMYRFSRPDARRIRRRTASALEFCWNEAGEWWGGDRLSDWCRSPGAADLRSPAERTLMTPWQPRDW